MPEISRDFLNQQADFHVWIIGEMVTKFGGLALFLKTLRRIRL